VSPENPLTARVAVNRFWEQLFGLGLVETLEDFGGAGVPPSNPELLDYLAIRFQGELGWSVKGLIREIVLSSTYRQSAIAGASKRELDPRNVFMSRGPRLRLTAEMVRDNALAVSGLLSGKMFGPPVMPHQPEGVWRTVYNQGTWKTSEGEDSHRRAIYTFFKRSTPYPSFTTFDAPSRDICMPRRITTNTPLQALVTLNDPVYMECASSLAARALKEAGDDSEQAIRYAYRRALLKEPRSEDLKSLERLYHDSLADFQGTDASEKALTLVANAILNLDDFLTK